MADKSTYLVQRLYEGDAPGELWEDVGEYVAGSGPEAIDLAVANALESQNREEPAAEVAGTYRSCAARYVSEPEVIETKTEVVVTRRKAETSTPTPKREAIAGAS